ncbi:MAG: acyl-CoA reductase [Firmicutes bacterium]|nr:acyl-CoA reductase [Bacillota bacterium]
MIFANGVIYDSKQQNDILDRLESQLNETLSHGTPPTPRVIIDACESLATKALNGLFNEELAGLGFEVGPMAQRIEEAASIMRKESLEAKVLEELGPDYLITDPTSASQWSPSSRRTLTPPYDHGRTLTKQRVPLGVLFHIAAGNVDGLPAFSVMEGLLAGNINILKLPSADNGLSLRMLEELVKEAPELAPYVYVFDTPSDDLPAILRMAGFADGIVVWGGEGAVETIRKFAPPGAKLIEWGHKLSFAYVTEQGITDDNLAALAHHIIETRQLLCSSCQTIFLDIDPAATTPSTGDGSPATGDAMTKLVEFCERFLPILEDAVIKSTPLDIGSTAQVTLRLYTQTLEGHAGHFSRRIFRGRGCSITLCEEGSPELSPQFGNVLVKPLPRQRLLPALRQKKSFLQTAGLLCGDDEREELTQLLFRAGIIRVTGPGSMSHTTALDAHDGEYPLIRYTRIVETRE